MDQKMDIWLSFIECKFLFIFSVFFIFDIISSSFNKKKKQSFFSIFSFLIQRKKYIFAFFNDNFMNFFFYKFLKINFFLFFYFLIFFFFFIFFIFNKLYLFCYFVLFNH